MPLEKDHESASAPAWGALLTAFVLGMTSLVTQVIVLRDCLAVFYGNELVIGTLLANWMVLTGIGASFGSYAEKMARRRGALIAVLLLLALLPSLTVGVLRVARNTVFPVGTMIDPVAILWSSFLLLLPYCLLAGFAFTLVATSASRLRRENMIPSVYAVEAIGSVAGGVAFSLLLIHVLNTFQALTMLLAINVLAALALSREHRLLRRLIWIGACLLLIPSLLVDIDTLSRRFLFPGQSIVHSSDSPYGNLTVTRQENQQNFFENNVLLASTEDVTGAEESVHFAMVQHPSPRNVLMVSGGASGAPGEVLKYNIDRLDYVELNPHIIEAIRRYTNVLNDRRINVVNDDARLFLTNAESLYDVVLLNTPEPSSIQTNRFYTAEFFGKVKAGMRRDAVLSLGLLSATDYQSDHARHINSTMMNTLRVFFKNVLLVPGLKTYFLASDGELNIRIGQLIAEQSMKTTYVNQYYLDDDDLGRRSALLRSTLDTTAALNADFEPVSYYRHLHYWLSYFRSGYWLVALIAAVLLFLLGRRLNAVSAGVISGGFAATCLEIVLLIAFQTLYGYVYQVLGIIITVFMAGLASGALIRSRIVPEVTYRTYGWIQIIIAGYAFLLAVLMAIAKATGVPPSVMHPAFFILAFVVAALVGVEFSAAAVLRTGDVHGVASELYSVDLVGSALGALLVSTYLIPALGLVGVSALVGLLSFCTALCSLKNRNETVLSPG